MSKVNPEYVARTIEFFNQSYARIGRPLVITDLQQGSALVEVTLDDTCLNPFGAVDGAFYAGLIDTVAALAGVLTYPEDTGTTTLDMQVTYVRSVSSGRVFAEGRVIRAGRSICMTEAEIKDEEGRLLSFGTSNLVVKQGLQLVSHAVQASGLGEMPPKFLDE